MLLHRAIAPFLDSTVVTIGKLRSTNGGHGSSLPSLGVVEHFRWTRLPQSENFSRLVHVPSEVWGCDSTVVTIGKLRSTNGGHGSPLSSLGVVEHFRWTRLPQSENFSRLVHILSEVWGCRRFDADVDRPQGRTPRIGTGVADILRKPSGTFRRLPLSLRPDSYTVTPATDLESTPRAESKGGVLPPLPRGERAGVRVIPSPACGVVITNQHPSHCHSDAPRGIWGGAPSPLPSTKLKGRACAAAQALPSVFPSPLSLKGPQSLPRVPRGGEGDQGGEGSLLKPDMQPSTASFQPPSRNPSFPSHQYQTRGSSWRRRANCSLCFSLPLSLKGPKGEGDKGGEGSFPALCATRNPQKTL